MGAKTASAVGAILGVNLVYRYKYARAIRFAIAPYREVRPQAGSYIFFDGRS